MNETTPAENDAKVEPEPGEISKSETGPTPNNPPWNSIVAFAFWILSVLLITIVPLIFLFAYLGPGGLRAQGQSSEAMKKIFYANPNAVLLALLGTLGAHVITLVCAWLIVTKLNKYSLRDVLGFKWGGFKLWHGAVIFVGVYALALGLNQIFGSTDNDMMKILRSSRTAVIVVAFIATFSAPIVEEIIYRGILYSAFQRSFGSIAAIAYVTLIFALVHVPQYYPDMANILSILVLSLVLTLIRAKTNNLLPCIFFHFVFNGFQSILLVLGPLLPDALDPTKAQSFILR